MKLVKNTISKKLRHIRDDGATNVRDVVNDYVLSYVWFDIDSKLNNSIGLNVCNRVDVENRKYLDNDK